MPTKPQSSTTDVEKKSPGEDLVVEPEEVKKPLVDAVNNVHDPTTPKS